MTSAGSSRSPSTGPTRLSDPEVDRPVELTGILVLVKFTVEIDDALWAKIRTQDAFASDEEALTRILVLMIVSSGQVKASTDLIIATNKVKVTKP